MHLTWIYFLFHETSFERTFFAIIYAFDIDLFCVSWKFFWKKFFFSSNICIWHIFIFFFIKILLEEFYRNTIALFFFVVPWLCVEYIFFFFFFLKIIKYSYACFLFVFWGLPSLPPPREIEKVRFRDFRNGWIWDP